MLHAVVGSQRRLAQHKHLESPHLQAAFGNSKTSLAEEGGFGNFM